MAARFISFTRFTLPALCMLLLATAGADRSAHAQTCVPVWANLAGGAPNGPVTAMAVFNDGGGPRLYVGGGFSTIGGVTVNGVAKWTGTGWAALGSGLGGKEAVQVNAMTVHNFPGVGPQLYVAGRFATAGGITVNSIARWTGSAWQSVYGGLVHGGSPATVNALTTFDDGVSRTLYAAGLFTIGGPGNKVIARLREGTWQSVSAGLPDMYLVQALTEFNGDLYAAVADLTIKVTEPRVRILKGNFTATGYGWTQVGAFWEGVPLDLVVHNDGTGGSTLFVSGSILLQGEIWTVKKLSGTTWNDIGGAVFNKMMTFSDGSGSQPPSPELFGVSSSGLVRKWSGSTWTTIGTANAPIRSLTSFYAGGGQRLFIGGEFSTVSGGGALRLASYGGCVVMGDFQVVDPISTPNMVINGAVTSNGTILANGGTLRTGIAADGATRVLLRQQAPGPGNMIFSVRDENDVQQHVGTLSSPGGNEQLTTMTVPITTLPDGTHWAFAVLRAPVDFVRPPCPSPCPDELAVSRLLKLKAEYAPQAGGLVTTNKQIDIRRPPVTLIHGLWSDASTWAWPLVNDALGRWVVCRQDYKRTNGAWFATNRGQPRRGIQSAVQMMRDQGIACTQADVFGHSMGGLLSRLYVSGAAGLPYQRSDNFNQGDIHKLVTVDTPHLGSPVANWLLTIAGSQSWLTQRVLEAGAAAAGYCFTCGAIHDLRTFNFTNMTPAIVPAHAMVGDGGSDMIQSALLATVLPPFGTILSLLNSYGYLPNLFPAALQHDLIVGRVSQQAGLTGSHFSLFGLALPNYGIHTTVTNETPNADRAEALLNTPITDTTVWAAGFPAISAGSIAGVEGDPLPPEPPHVSGISITEPAPNSTFSAGQSLTVSVSPINGFVPAHVLFIVGGNTVLDEAAPFTASVPTDPATLGPVPVAALAGDANGVFALAPYFLVQSQTTAQLVSIAVRPNPLFLFDFAPQDQVTVIGSFTDSIDRDISSGFGVTYQSLDPSVVTVDSSGMVRSMTAGVATVTATSGGISGSTTVNVVSPRRLGDATLDGMVDVDDLIAVILAWGPCPAPPQPCPADVAPHLAGNGQVDVDDLITVILGWGS